MAKSRKAKVPKRIAGVKVPKALRRAGRPLAQFAATPLGREIVAEAVVAATIALARSRPVRQAASEVSDGAARATHGMADIARAAAAPMVRAAQDMVSRTKQDDDLAPEPKKKRRDRPETEAEAAGPM